MAFASKFAGMLYFASSVGLLALASNGGCIATSPVEFDPAQKAFGHTSAYDAAIHQYLAGRSSEPLPQSIGTAWRTAT